jgi:AraC-like DNA-binding protein
MKPKLLQVSANVESSFSVRHETVPTNHNKWHYHPEVEIVYFKKGCGTQFIGDHISRFMSGDIMVIGANLPHYWRFDDQYVDVYGHAPADITVIHFSEIFWGQNFLQLAENKMIKTMLEKAKRGLLLHDENKQQVAQLMEMMPYSQASTRIILLLKVLLAISNCKQITALSSIGFKYDYKEQENDRINAIYQYSLANFRSRIQLEEIAEIVHICPNSFCRYFKSRTKKTYSQFLIEIKVGNACKLLIENKLTIKQLCTESGFNSFSSFHKYFKKITGKSPAMYKNEFIQQAKITNMSSLVQISA